MSDIDESDHLTQLIIGGIMEHFAPRQPDDALAINSLLRALCFIMSELTPDDEFIIASVTKNMPELLRREREFTKDIPRPRPKPNLNLIDGGKLN